MKSSACARAAAARISSSVASGLPTRRFSAIERLNSSTSWNTTPMLRRSAASLSPRMSMPSILTEPDCGSNTRCSSASAVDLPAPVGPTSATISPGSAVKLRSATAGALAVVGERHVGEFDQAAHAAGIDGVGPVAHRRHGVGDLEEFLQPRRVHEQAVGEAHRLFEPGDQHAGEAREGDDLADRGQAVDVEPDADDEDRQHGERGRGARQHGADRPPRQHRHLRAEQLARPRCCSPITSASMREKLCTSATLPSASEARSARSP